MGIANLQAAVPPRNRPQPASPSRPPAKPEPEPERVSFPSLSFPKERTVLCVFEVARRLRMSQQHVVDLIEEGKLRAVNIAGGPGHGRKYYRIPVEAWEAYVLENLR